LSLLVACKKKQKHEKKKLHIFKRIYFYSSQQSIIAFQHITILQNFNDLIKTLKLIFK